MFAATAIYVVSPTEVTVRLISAANVNASLDASFSVTYHGVTLTAAGSGSATVARLTQGGHATMKEDVGSTWVADAADFVSFTDVAGAHLDVSAPIAGTYHVFSVAPSSFGDDYAYMRTFTKSF